MDDWLSDARNRLAEASGESPDSLGLSQTEVDELLELARVAAHSSGERINAPLLCYLVGLTKGRTGADLSGLVDATVGK
ncbi:MAG TPA: DUF6457 domain-containing protein [Gaiellaceae bacterium]|nr:DUF6457 domain-containing protein [Gaiellaceae bacterium]